MIRVLVLAALLAVAPDSEPSPQTAGEPAADAATHAGTDPAAQARRAELVSGKLPDDPARAIVERSCTVCHSVDYVTQQRLTPAQWRKTVEKMRTFGAPLTDDEVKQVSEYLGNHWTVDLPERRPSPSAPPRTAPSR